MYQQLKTFEMNYSRFPIHPQRAYNKYLAEPINDLVQSYHSQIWIQLEDNIHFNDTQEYLKRIYKYPQYKNKIKLLGQYYRYHFQAPRLYMQDIGRIIQTNIEQKRAVQFALVTKQMHGNDSQNTTPAISHRERPKDEKIIKDVELSYEDFETRPIKKQKIIIQTEQFISQLHKKIKQNIPFLRQQSKNKQKILTRVDSVNCKGSFLVFKPRTQINKKIQTNNKNKAQPKYKKPKQDPKYKNIQNTKKQINSKGKLVSKVNSTNNSLASHQGLSRSKSKAQLHIVQRKKLDLNKQYSQKHSIAENNKQRSNNISQQNSIVRSVGKKSILGDKKAFANNLSRKASKADLKNYQKTTNNSENYKTQRQILQNIQNAQKYNHQENSKGIKSHAISRKPSCGNIETKQLPKKMFTKAIQIKRKNK